MSPNVSEDWLVPSLNSCDSSLKSCQTRHQFDCEALKGIKPKKQHTQVLQRALDQFWHRCWWLKHFIWALKKGPFTLPPFNLAICPRVAASWQITDPWPLFEVFLELMQLAYVFQKQPHFWISVSHTLTQASWSESTSYHAYIKRSIKALKFSFWTEPGDPFEFDVFSSSSFYSGLSPNTGRNAVWISCLFFFFFFLILFLRRQ